MEFVNKHRKPIMYAALCLMMMFSIGAAAFADEDVYNRLAQITKSQEEVSKIKRLNEAGRTIDWGKAQAKEFRGHLRILKTDLVQGIDDVRMLYLVRNINGEIYILSVPAKDEVAGQEIAKSYEQLADKLEYKMTLKVLAAQQTVDGVTYDFARFSEPPVQLPLDRIFKTSIVLMMFFVMLGMGLTLTMNDFKVLLQKPKGILTGVILHWAVLPFVAVGIGKIFGFFELFPFIYVGIVLIAVGPGGVTSNLMTYYAKGDVALSIALTSFSTVLSLFFTPLLLTLLCANIPEVTIPVKLVVQTIIIMIIIPLALGMFIRSRWQKFAEKSIGFFSTLGIIALLFIMGAGLLGNYEMFADTKRYGVKFYSAVIILAMSGLLIGAIVPKILGINNFQIRALSIETGVRSGTVAMALSLLMQDYMGDFHASMFFTSAIYGLLVFPVVFMAIAVMKKLLPVEPQPPISAKPEEGEY